MPETDERVGAIESAILDTGHCPFFGGDPRLRIIVECVVGALDAYDMKSGMARCSVAMLRAAEGYRERTRQAEPSDRDLLRALAAAHLGEDLIGDRDVDDLFDAGLIASHRDICDEYETSLTDKARDAIRQAINREE